MTERARFEARDLARIAVFAAIIVVLGYVSIPLPGLVPITGQTLGVMLAGAVLGWYRGVLSVLVVLLLAAIGLPVLAGGSGGLGVFVGPTVGYLIGWAFGAAVTGLIAHGGRGRIRWWRVALGNVVGGILVIYAFGIPFQALILHMSVADAAWGSLVFLPGDLLKVVVATLLAVTLYRAYPAAFGVRRLASPTRPLTAEQ